MRRLAYIKHRICLLLVCLLALNACELNIKPERAKIVFSDDGVNFPKLYVRLPQKTLEDILVNNLDFTAHLYFCSDNVNIYHVPLNIGEKSIVELDLSDIKKSKLGENKNIELNGSIPRDRLDFKQANSHKVCMSFEGGNYLFTRIQKNNIHVSIENL